MNITITADTATRSRATANFTRLFLRGRTCDYLAFTLAILRIGQCRVNQLAGDASGKHNRVMPAKYFTAAEDKLVLTLPAAEAQRITGRSLKTIGVRRVLLKRMGFKVADQRTSAEKLKVGRSAWTPEADRLVRQHRPSVVRTLKIPMPTVLRRRKALGLPPIGPYRVPEKPRVRDAYRKWTKTELRIVLSLPPREAIKRLPGRTKSAIHAVRNMRKRKGIKFRSHRGRPRKVEQ